jgi:signal peptidase II
MQDRAGAPLTGADPAAPVPAPAAVPGRRRRLVVLGALAAVVFLVDQLSKTWALASLTPGDPVPLVGSWIELDLIRNPGAAFSLGDGSTWLLTAISVGIVVWVLFAARRVGTMPWAVALGLLLGGALGNIADRLFREPGPGRGHVVDFIDYFGLFIGNVADIAIVVAAGLIMVLAFLGVPLRGPVRARAADPGEHADG